MPLYRQGMIAAPSAPVSDAVPPATNPGTINNSGANTDNEISVATSGQTVPTAGGMLQVLRVWCFMAGHTAAVNTQGAIWAANGGLLNNSDIRSVAQGTGVGGGQFWTGFAVPWVLLNPGLLYFPGFFRQASQDAEWSVFGSGSFSFNTSASLGSFTANACANPFICGAPGIYIEYMVPQYRRGDCDR